MNLNIISAIFCGLMGVLSLSNGNMIGASVGFGFCLINACLGAIRSE